jgi:hypothetical protein
MVLALATFVAGNEDHCNPGLFRAVGGADSHTNTTQQALILRYMLFVASNMRPRHHGHATAPPCFALQAVVQKTPASHWAQPATSPAIT